MQVLQKAQSDIDVINREIEKRGNEAETPKKIEKDAKKQK